MGPSCTFPEMRSSLHIGKFPVVNCKSLTTSVTWLLPSRLLEHWARGLGRVSLTGGWGVRWRLFSRIYCTWILGPQSPIFNSTLDSREPELHIFAKPNFHKRNRTDESLTRVPEVSPDCKITAGHRIDQRHMQGESHGSNYL